MRVGESRVLELHERQLSEVVNQEIEHNEVEGGDQAGGRIDSWAGALLRQRK
jgi:hypothetical protein